MKIDRVARSDRLRRRTALAACALLLALAGCATGPDNVVIDLPPYAAQAAAGSAAARGTVGIDPVRDARRDAVGGLIGERKTFDMPMGFIELRPPPTTLIAGVLQAELAGLGFAAGAAGEPVRIAPLLTKFEVATPSTALYWDIHGAVELDLAATAPGGRRLDTRHAARCTARTYAWPSAELIRGVVADCLEDLGARIRGDAALAAFLAAR